MRAWQVHHHAEPDDALRVVELPRPEAPHDGVLIEVEASGLNFPDLLLCRGTYHERPPLPFVPGFEVCGHVVEAGRTSTRRPGQRVVAATAPPAGGLAELVAVPDSAVFDVTDDVDADVAAGMFITYQTAHLALHRRARLAQGETCSCTAAREVWDRRRSSSRKPPAPA